jgi:hypothetical protein
MIGMRRDKPLEAGATSMRLLANEFLIRNFGYDKLLTVRSAGNSNSTAPTFFRPDRKNPLSPNPYNFLSPRHDVAKIRCEFIRPL